MPTLARSDMRSNHWIYAVNAHLLLSRLPGGSRQVTLAGVPDEYWGALSGRFDLVWLLGVWERSPAARQQALTNPQLRREYAAALSDQSARDVGASPYAVRRYRLEAALGRADELTLVHERLRRNGLGLILDFVSNHVARDHPWTMRQPEYFIRPSAAALARNPDWFFEARPGVFLAHGRDPNFPPWTDTAQFDFSSPELRRALIGELLAIAQVSDGVRCDMAMLALNDVHATTWTEAGGERRRLASEFWAEAITTVRRLHPDFLFIAEAYWGMGPRLLQLGFDYVYDKELYDSLREGAAAVRGHLASDNLGPGALRFIENHDENRSAAVFPLPQALAATAMIATLPGALLINDGQLEGRRKRVPVQLLREPEEPIDDATARGYDALLSVLRTPPIGFGVWTRLRFEPPPSAETGLFAWRWDGEPTPCVVLVNYSSKGVAAVIDAAHGRDGFVQIHEEVTPQTATVAQRARTLTATLGPWEVRVLSIPDSVT